MHEVKIVTLVSCMQQHDKSIIEYSNIQTDAVVVNQCDYDKVEEFDYTNKKGKLCHVKFICTRERGLSRSRNMAICNSWGDICLICDDDEKFEDDVENIILNAYSKNKNASVITFAFNRKGKTFPMNEQRIGLVRILKTSSVEISFKRGDIVHNNILFDVKMGSGSGNGAGEENKFLIDCYRKKLEMMYCPHTIATLLSEDSKWFKGYDHVYFRNLGWSTRRTLGIIIGGIYLLYSLIAHYKLFSSEISIIKVGKYMLFGFLETDR